MRARDQVEQAERITERVLARSRPILRGAGQEQRALTLVEAPAQNRLIDVSFDAIEKPNDARCLLRLHTLLRLRALALLSSLRFLRPFFP